MPAHCVLLFTDVEGSTQLTEQLGDEAASLLWSAHDRAARELLRRWRGREIDKSDGFLLLFEAVDDALAFALDLHLELAGLTPPLASRAGIHRGTLVERENPAVDVAMGAKPVEVDGVAKAVASRIMALARGGQTLLSAAAHEALGEGRWQTQSHGHWRMKGLAEPIELFEAGHAAGALPMLPPPDSAKSYRVLRADEGWMPVAQLRHGLPAERDGFVGRGEALAALAACFAGGARLVTVLGIGGIGKTRLALRYARDWLGDYPGGAWFCDLSSARSLDGIVHAVAQGLDVPLGKADPVQQLGAAIAGRGECLVILDNFEQVARHAEATVGQWLERAPLARLLVTSREVLGVVGEEAFVLAPLAMDEAVLLFERRARAADGRYVARDEDRAVLARLVELLDRLPLAIELAAARVRVMTAQAMLDRMGERFKLLASSGGRRDRQATLRAALDWSWELLSLAERSALAQLSVFEGGFTLSAAEEVVEVGGLDGNVWVADVLQNLIQKSLVRRTSDSRFGLLISVRDYACHRLEVEDECTTPRGSVVQRTSRRHFGHFARMTELELQDRGLEDIENLVVAFRGSLNLGERDTAADLLVLCSDALMLTGPATMALALHEELGDHSDLGARRRSAVERALGSVQFMLGHIEPSRQAFLRGLDCAAVAGDEAMSVRQRCALAEVHLRLGMVDEAKQQLNSALEIANQLQDPRLTCVALNRLAALELQGGNLAEAVEHIERGLVAARRLGHRRMEGGLLGNLGVARFGQGRKDDAEAAFRDALNIGESVGDRQWAANARCNLAFLLFERREFDAARLEFERVLGIARDTGHTVLACTALCNLGQVSLARQQVPSAVTQLGEAAGIATQIGERRLEAECRRHLADALCRLGLFERARSEITVARAIASRLPDDGETCLLAIISIEIEFAAGAVLEARTLLDGLCSLADSVSPASRSVVWAAIDRLGSLVRRSALTPPR